MGPKPPAQLMSVLPLVNEGARHDWYRCWLSPAGTYQIRYYAGELTELPAELAAHEHATPKPSPVPLRVTPALDAAPELADALAERWRALDAINRGRPLLLVAHGPSSDAEAERWTSNLDSAAARIRREEGSGRGGTPATTPSRARRGRGAHPQYG
jgi:hypothetical protein